MTVTIRTNNVPRDIIEAWELSPKEQKEFDYLDWEAIADGSDSASFFRYHGELYDLSQFERIPQHGLNCEKDFCEWHGYQSDSYFSGIVVRYVDNFERIIVGTYCC